MTSEQQRGARRVRRVRPVVMMATLAVVLLGAITGVSMLTPDAAAFTGLTGGSVTHKAAGPAKSVRRAQPSAGSATPSSPAVDPAGPATVAGPSSSSPVAQLPPLNSPSPTPTPSPSPSDTPPAPAPSGSPTQAAPSSPTPQDTDSRSAPTTQTAPPGPEANRVGALFSAPVGPGNHFCTASVVHSAARDLLLTAAHCVSGGASGVTFAPGYRDGKAPFGTWQVTKVFTTNGWSQNGDPDQDFAFLQLAPNSSGQQVEDVVGSENLGLNEPFTATVRLYGYPNATDEPIVCSNATTQQSAYQRRIDCPAYPNGTSGGPWISTATGNVIGVIGGYQQGGDTDDTSYSAYFDSTIGNLYYSATGS
ncbi:trypsin-like peptidase domain-containing protein [Kitasatospora sp. RB6PN24]|uniref:trypsin-like serine peptidase n=1 Tax=Kitasatospora humi TaxID=2893891 RepID=UPI001E5EA3C3|nr:serine protease [Kitasatospora humi]MCC9306884.1 trypsin-like peptidase domain-containing protein [Kitasatospora humi]